MNIIKSCFKQRTVTTTNYDAGIIDSVSLSTNDNATENEGTIDLLGSSMFKINTPDPYCIAAITIEWAAYWACLANPFAWLPDCIPPTPCKDYHFVSEPEMGTWDWQLNPLSTPPAPNPIGASTVHSDVTEAETTHSEPCDTGGDCTFQNGCDGNFPLGAPTHSSGTETKESNTSVPAKKSYTFVGPQPGPIPNTMPGKERVVHSRHFSAYGPEVNGFQMGYTWKITQDYTRVEQIGRKEDECSYYCM